MLRLLAALAAACACAPALAARPADAGTFRVAIPVRDLDLDSPGGRAAFASRVDRLAKRSCAPRAFPSAYEPRSLEACLKAFRAAAQTAAAERSARDRAAGAS